MRRRVLPGFGLTVSVTWAYLGLFVLLPLAVPLLIFGAGALVPGNTQALKLLAATALLLTAGASFAAGAALRSFRD